MRWVICRSRRSSNYSPAPATAATDYRVKDYTAGTTEGYHYDSINFGAGGQYSFTPHDAVRVDYTRFDAQGHDNPDSNVFNVSYVRKF